MMAATAAAAAAAAAAAVADTGKQAAAGGGGGETEARGVHGDGGADERVPGGAAAVGVYRSRSPPSPGTKSAPALLADELSLFTLAEAELVLERAESQEETRQSPSFYEETTPATVETKLHIQTSSCSVLLESYPVHQTDSEAVKEAPTPDATDEDADAEDSSDATTPSTERSSSQEWTEEEDDDRWIRRPRHRQQQPFAQYTAEAAAAASEQPAANTAVKETEDDTQQQEEQFIETQVEVKPTTEFQVTLADDNSVTVITQQAQTASGGEDAPQTGSMEELSKTAAPSTRATASDTDMAANAAVKSPTCVQRKKSTEDMRCYMIELDVDEMTDSESSYRASVNTKETENVTQTEAPETCASSTETHNESGGFHTLDASPEVPTACTVADTTKYSSPSQGPLKETNVTEETECYMMEREMYDGMEETHSSDNVTPEHMDQATKAPCDTAQQETSERIDENQLSDNVWFKTNGIAQPAKITGYMMEQDIADDYVPQTCVVPDTSSVSATAATGAPKCLPRNAPIYMIEQDPAEDMYISEPQTQTYHSEVYMDVADYRDYGIWTMAVASDPTPAGDETEAGSVTAGAGQQTPEHREGTQVDNDDDDDLEHFRKRLEQQDYDDDLENSATGVEQVNYNHHNPEPSGIISVQEVYDDDLERFRRGLVPLFQDFKDDLEYLRKRLEQQDYNDDLDPSGTDIDRSDDAATDLEASHHAGAATKHVAICTFTPKANCLRLPVAVQPAGEESDAEIENVNVYQLDAAGRKLLDDALEEADREVGEESGAETLEYLDTESAGTDSVQDTCHDLEHTTCNIELECDTEFIEFVEHESHPREYIDYNLDYWEKKVVQEDCRENYEEHSGTEVVQVESSGDLDQAGTEVEQEDCSEDLEHAAPKSIEEREAVEEGRTETLEDLHIEDTGTDSVHKDCNDLEHSVIEVEQASTDTTVEGKESEEALFDDDTQQQEESFINPQVEMKPAHELHVTITTLADDSSVTTITHSQSASTCEDAQQTDSAEELEAAAVEDVDCSDNLDHAAPESIQGGEAGEEGGAETLEDLQAEATCRESEQDTCHDLEHTKCNIELECHTEFIDFVDNGFDPRDYFDNKLKNWETKDVQEDCSENYNEHSGTDVVKEDTGGCLEQARTEVEQVDCSADLEHAAPKSIEEREAVEEGRTETLEDLQLEASGTDSVHEDCGDLEHSATKVEQASADTTVEGKEMEGALFDDDTQQQEEPFINTQVERKSTTEFQMTVTDDSSVTTITHSQSASTCEDAQQTDSAEELEAAAVEDVDCSDNQDHAAPDPIQDGEAGKEGGAEIPEDLQAEATCTESEEDTCYDLEYTKTEVEQEDNNDDLEDYGTGVELVDYNDYLETVKAVRAAVNYILDDEARTRAHRETSRGALDSNETQECGGEAVVCGEVVSTSRDEPCDQPLESSASYTLDENELKMTQSNLIEDGPDGDNKSLPQKEDVMYYMCLEVKEDSLVKHDLDKVTEAADIVDLSEFMHPTVPETTDTVAQWAVLPAEIDHISKETKSQESFATDGVVPAPANTQNQESASCRRFTAITQTVLSAPQVVRSSTQTLAAPETFMAGTQTAEAAKAATQTPDVPPAFVAVTQTPRAGEAIRASTQTPPLPQLLRTGTQTPPAPHAYAPAFVGITQTPPQAFVAATQTHAAAASERIVPPTSILEGLAMAATAAQTGGVPRSAASNTASILESLAGAASTQTPPAPEALAADTQTHTPQAFAAGTQTVAAAPEASKSAAEVTTQTALQGKDIVQMANDSMRQIAERISDNRQPSSEAESFEPPRGEGPLASETRERHTDTDNLNRGPCNVKVEETATESATQADQPQKCQSHPKPELAVEVKHRPDGTPATPKSQAAKQPHSDVRGTGCCVFNKVKEEASTEYVEAGDVETVAAAATDPAGAQVFTEISLHDDDPAAVAPRPPTPATLGRRKHKAASPTPIKTRGSPKRLKLPPAQHILPPVKGAAAAAADPETGKKAGKKLGSGFKKLFRSSTNNKN